MLAARWRRPPRGSQDMSSTVGFKQLMLDRVRIFSINLSLPVSPGRSQLDANVKEARDRDENNFLFIITTIATLFGKLF
jgi:hypothetical protein